VCRSSNGGGSAGWRARHLRASGASAIELASAQITTFTRHLGVQRVLPVLVFGIRDEMFADTQVYESDPQQDDLFWS